MFVWYNYHPLEILSLFCIDNSRIPNDFYPTPLSLSKTSYFPFFEIQRVYNSKATTTTSYLIVAKYFFVDSEVKIKTICDIILKDPYSALVNLLVDGFQVIQIPRSVIQ